MEKIAIGMSGGVDSSVAALLLKKQGYEVVGITMKMFDSESTSQMISDAKSVCEKLNIEHIVLDCTNLFKEKVIDNFVCSYANCLTPNPCIECNRYIKFKYMFDEVKKLGIDKIATGHYAKIEFNESINQNVIRKNDSSKDQTYFLYGIPRELLNNIVFPLSNYTDKQDIRKIAEDNDLIVAHKKDSQEVCFVPNDDYVSFLETNENFKKQIGNNAKEGNIVHIDGKVLGKHEGLYKYTIGQRKGMGISYSEPIYVVDVNKEKNELYVGSEQDLEKNELVVNNVNLLTCDKVEDGMRVKVKIRYRSKEEEATLYNEKLNGEDVIKVVFDNNVKRVTKGQSAVFYEDTILIGGGKII